MKFYFLVLVCLFHLACVQKKSEDISIADKSDAEVVLQDVSLEVINYEGLEKLLKNNDDKTYVINFWATWCGPCVKELPYFEQLSANYKAKGVEVILLSLDFPHVYESKLKPFIKNKKIQSRVIAFNDPNENEWINKIDPSWSGSIPATIICNSNNRKFFERSFTFEELENEVKQFLN